MLIYTLLNKFQPSQSEFFHLLNDLVQEIIRRAGFLDESDISLSGDHDSDFDERIYDDVASLRHIGISIKLIKSFNE